MWGASYLGLTQWAIAEDAPDVRQGARPSGHRLEFPRHHHLSRRIVRPRDGVGVALPNEAPGARPRAPCCERSCAPTRSLTRTMQVLPLGKSDVATLGEVSPPFQDWLEHSEPGDPWWDEIGLRAPARQGPARQLRRRLVRPVLAGAGRGLRGAPPGRPDGPHHGRPVDPRQPRPLRRERPRRARLVRQAARGAARQGAPCAGPRLRHGLRTWEDFSLWPPAGEHSVVPRAMGHARHRTHPAPARRDRYHYNPHDPTPAIGGAGLDFVTTGRKDQRTREHRHDVLTYTSPVLTEDLTVIGPLTATLYLRSFARAHGLLRAALRRVAEGQVGQPQRRHHPPDARIGREGRGRASSGSSSPCGRRPTRSAPATGSACRCRAVPIRCTPAMRGPGNPWATGANLRAADQEVFHDAGQAVVHHAAGRPSAGGGATLVGDQLGAPRHARCAASAEWVARTLGLVSRP